MNPSVVVALLASSLSELLSEPRSLFTTFVALLVVWYAWSRVTADPDLERAKRVYEERRADRENEAGDADDE